MPKVSMRVVVSMIVLGSVAAVTAAQQSTFKRTEVQRGDLSVEGREVVQAVAEIPKGVAAGRHTHPGEEVGYVLEGIIVLDVEGWPARTVKAGEGFIIPAGRVHDARSTGRETARVLGTYVIEKGKPMATPAK